MGLFGSRVSIGLDLGSHTLKAVEVVPSGGGFKVTHLAAAPTPAGAVADGAAASADVLGAAIRNLMIAAGIKGTRVVTALGGEAVIVRELKLPEMPPAELEQAVAYEAERYLPYGVREVSRDFQVLGRPWRRDRWRSSSSRRARRSSAVNWRLCRRSGCRRR